MQPPSNHAVPKEAWQHTDLQGEPVFGLTDVKDVAGVCRTCWRSVSTRSGGVRDRRHTLVFFTSLKVFCGQPEFFALLYVQVDLVPDVGNDLCRLLRVSFLH